MSEARKKVPTTPVTHSTPFRVEDAPPELRDNPIVRYMAEIDPATAKLLDEAAALDHELGVPADLPDADDE